MPLNLKMIYRDETLWQTDFPESREREQEYLFLSLYWLCVGEHLHAYNKYGCTLEYVRVLLLPSYSELKRQNASYS